MAEAAPIVPATPAPAVVPPVAAPVVATAPAAAALPQPGTVPLIAPIEAPKGPTAADKAEEARKGFQFRQQQREIKAKQDQLVTDRKVLEQDAALAKNAPLKFLEKHGITFAEMTRRVLSGQEEVGEAEQTQKTVVEDVAALKKQIADKDLAEQQARDLKIVNDWRAEVRNHLDKTPELELCRVDIDDAVANIEAIVRLKIEQTGEVMPFAEAAQRFEAFREKQADEYFSKSEKLKKKYGPPVPAPTEAKPGEKGSPAPSPEGKAGGVPAPDKPAEGQPTSSVPKRSTRTLSNGLDTAPGTKTPGLRKARGALSISDAIAAASKPIS